MRRSRTLKAALALVVLAAPAAMATSAYAEEPIGLPVSVALPEETRCDVTAYADPGVALTVGMYTRDLTTARSNSTGAPIPHTQVDDTWVVAPSSPAYSVAKHAAWIAPATGNWINSRTTNASGGTGIGPIEVKYPELTVDPGSDSVAGLVNDVAAIGSGTTLPTLPSKTRFRTTFTIPAQSYLNRLDLRYAADNGVSFYLNTVLIGGFDPAGADPTAFQQERPLVYTGPLLQDGTNVLDAVVTDYGVATGLLVRGALSGCRVLLAGPGTCLDIQESAVYASHPQRIDISTGSQGGVRDAYGAVDTKWRSLRYWTDPRAYSVAPYSGWFSNLTTANWIHEQPNPSTGSLGHTYPYEISFPVGPNVLYAEFDFKYAADDTARFYLNNTPIGAGGNWWSLTPFQWKGTFTSGTMNRLMVEVVDSGLVASGLLVQGEARVCYKRAIS